MCTINQDYMMYNSWDIKCKGQSFLSFWAILLSDPPNNPKNQNFEKMKQTPEDIIILHQCTKNPDHMLYCSWDMVCDRCNCQFSFWAIFCPFTPITEKKKENFKKKWKQCLEILSSFYTSVPKIMIICYNVPEQGLI